MDSQLLPFSQQASQSPKTLPSLPVEILLQIIAYLELDSACALVLCNRRTKELLGDDHLRELRSCTGSKQRREFLLLMARDAPDVIYCHLCWRLHLPYSGSNPLSTVARLDGGYCRTREWVVLSQDHSIHHQMLQFLMKRHRQGIDITDQLDKLKTICIPPHDNGTGIAHRLTPHKSDFKLRVHENRLYLHAQTQIQLQTLWIPRSACCSKGWFCMCTKRVYLCEHIAVAISCTYSREGFARLRRWVFSELRGCETDVNKKYQSTRSARSCFFVAQPAVCGDGEQRLYSCVSCEMRGKVAIRNPGIRGPVAFVTVSRNLHDCQPGIGGYWRNHGGLSPHDIPGLFKGQMFDLFDRTKADIDTETDGPERLADYKSWKWSVPNFIQAALHCLK